MYFDLLCLSAYLVGLFLIMFLIWPFVDEIMMWMFNVPRVFTFYAGLIISFFTAFAIFQDYASTDLRIIILRYAVIVFAMMSAAVSMIGTMTAMMILKYLEVIKPDIENSEKKNEQVTNTTPECSCDAHINDKQEIEIKP